MPDIHIPRDKPKSLILFLAFLVAGVFLFAPMAAVGLSMEKVPMFLTGTAGVAITFLTAASMALLFAAGLHAGRYREMHELPWRDQVW
jgi:hypothetical protein